MGETENFSIYDLIKNLKDEVEKGKKDCRSEANDLLKKIFRAVEVHTDFPNVNKGLDELAVKFSDLEEKLSTMTKERDSLLDMLDNLKFENRQFHAMLSQIIQEKDHDDYQLRAAIMLLSTEMLQKTKSFSPSTMPGRYSIAKVSKKVGKSTEMLKKTKSLSRSTMLGRYSIAKGSKIVSKSASYGDPNETGQITKESDEESTSTSEDESAKENEINDTEPGIVSSDRDVSPASNIRFVPTKNRLVKNEKVNQNYKPDVAKKSILEDEKRSANNREKKDFHCERCSYSAARKDTLKRHGVTAHGDDKKFKCERCSFSAARKDSLQRHGVSAHGDGKKFKCGIPLCPYLTARKDNLKKHVESKHGNGRTQRP